MVTLTEIINALQLANGGGIGGVSAKGITRRKGRGFFVGGDNTTRTPLYEVVDGTQQPVTDSEGRDCWYVCGQLEGVHEYTTEYKGKQVPKVSVDVAAGSDGNISILMGAGTHAAISLLQLLIVADKPTYIEIKYLRGSDTPTVVFCQIRKSEDGEKWVGVSTLESEFEGVKSKGVEYSAELVSRLTESEEN